MFAPLVIYFGCGAKRLMRIGPMIIVLSSSTFLFEIPVSSIGTVALAGGSISEEN